MVAWPILRRLVLTSVCAVVLADFVGVGGALAAAGVNISTVEGRPFTGTVVNGLVCPLLSATINWGDGTATSVGTDDGSHGIRGTHTYAEESTYQGSVSYTYSGQCGSSLQTASFQATVQDALLTVGGKDVSGTVGQPVSGVVAHFSDANPAADAGDFSAQIGWGDGSKTFGTVTAAATGGFDVSGTHTYATTGSFAVSTSITDIGGSTAGASSAAQITAPVGPPVARLTVTPNPTCTGVPTKLDGGASSAPAGIVAYRFEYDAVSDSYNPDYQVLVSDGKNPAPVTQFTWNSYTSASGIGGILGGVVGFRDPTVVTLTITDARGATATATAPVTFAQASSLQGSEHCPPAFRLIAGFPFASGHKFPHLTFSSGRITTVLPCHSTTLCIGSLSVLSTHNLRAGAARQRKPQLIARAVFFVEPGKSKRVQTRLTKTGQRLLRAHKQIRASVVITALTPTGKLVKRSKTITLKSHR